jgi:hypothetical protein
VKKILNSDFLVRLKSKRPNVLILRFSFALSAAKDYWTHTIRIATLTSDRITIQFANLRV